MVPFPVLQGIPMQLLMKNVDTDIITPMKRLTGGNERPLADYAFEAWRYEGGNADTGQPLADFPLNQAQFSAATILLSGENFGCGSSRQSAPQVLYDLGFRCLIGVSYGEIFFNNCFQLGILPIVVSKETVDMLVASGMEVRVDLVAEELSWGNEVISFDVNSLRKRCLLEGLDDIELTLSRVEKINEFQAADRRARPWVYGR